MQYCTKDFLTENLSEQKMESQMATGCEARNDFWSISGNHIYRHAEPSVNVYVPHEWSIPIPRKCIDVVKQTNTTIDGCIAGKSF